MDSLLIEQIQALSAEQLNLLRATMNQPSREHEDIICFLNAIITTEFLRLNLNHGISKTALVKPTDAESIYSPDILILNRSYLKNEPLWQKMSTVSQATSIPLIVEIVSTNWKVDYETKVSDYEAMGVSEYWIVDYLAYGGKRFIGYPKQPTISIYHLSDGEYEVKQFRGDQPIISPAFPELNLTANQIFSARN